MTITVGIITGLLMGMVFGFALEKSRVFEPGIIVGQMQLRSFIMLKVFLSAVITGLIVVMALATFGLTTLHPKATLVGADVLGGLILGAGITLAGACPGTVLAQIGAGYKDAWLTLLGGLLGALTFSLLEPVLRPMLLSGGPGKLTLDVALRLPFPMVALGFGMLLLAVVVALERWRPWRQELGDSVDGVLPVA
jgi:hypothetical protein